MGSNIYQSRVRQRLNCPWSCIAAYFSPDNSGHLWIKNKGKKEVKLHTVQIGQQVCVYFLSFSYIHQIYSRLHWKRLGKNMNIEYRRKHCDKRKIAYFSYCRNVLKSSAGETPKSICMWERVKIRQACLKEHMCSMSACGWKMSRIKALKVLTARG